MFIFIYLGVFVEKMKMTSSKCSINRDCNKTSNFTSDSIREFSIIAVILTGLYEREVKEVNDITEVKEVKEVKWAYEIKWV